MEGDDCYKFTTIQNYIAKTNAKPVKTIVEIGVNVGNVTWLMREAFPDAHIYGFEAVAQWYNAAVTKMAGDTGVTLYNAAVSAQHLFFDDLGRQPRESPTFLRILKGKPSAGCGWIGGSAVVPDDHPILSELCESHLLFEQTAQETLAVVLDDFLRENALDVDFLKIDCEGCEHSVLGCASLDTLRSIRFIAGEYHEFARFYRVLQHKLFATHRVNIVGSAHIGCFFAERIDNADSGILMATDPNMLQLRDWLYPEPTYWHLFNTEYVNANQKAAHGIL
jgi:FkbM family methyltransferase